MGRAAARELGRARGARGAGLGAPGVGPGAEAASSGQPPSPALALQIYYYADQIYLSAGVPEEHVQYVTAGTGAVNVVMTFCAVSVLGAAHSLHPRPLGPPRPSLGVAKRAARGPKTWRTSRYYRNSVWEVAPHQPLTLGAAEPHRARGHHLTGM